MKTTTAEKMNESDTEQVNTATTSRSDSGSRLDRIEKSLVRTIELQQDLNKWLEGEVKHRAELHKEQKPRLDKIEAAQTRSAEFHTKMEERFAANVEFQSKLDTEDMEATILRGVRRVKNPCQFFQFAIYSLQQRQYLK